MKTGLLLTAKYSDLSSFMLGACVKSGMQYEEVALNKTKVLLSVKQVKPIFLYTAPSNWSLAPI